MFFIYFGDQTLVQGKIGKHIFPYDLFPFHFAYVFFAMQKLFNLRYSHLFILSFLSLALGDISVKILLCEISEIFLPMFPSRTFMVSQLLFKFYIHLEFISRLSYMFHWSVSVLMPVPAVLITVAL